MVSSNNARDTLTGGILRAPAHPQEYKRGVKYDEVRATGAGRTNGTCWYPPVTPASSAYMISLRWRSGCPIVCPDESATRSFRGDADGCVASPPRVMKLL